MTSYSPLIMFATAALLTGSTLTTILFNYDLRYFAQTRSTSRQLGLFYKRMFICLYSLKVSMFTHGK